MSRMLKELRKDTCFEGHDRVKCCKIYKERTMYAIIAHSGKQYNVKPGLKFNVEKIEHEAGSEIKLENVLLFHDGTKLHVGTPNVASTAVLVRVVEHGRGEKVKIIKLKRRKHHMKRQGHRQSYTRLEVLAIGDAKSVKAPKAESAPKAEKKPAAKAAVKKDAAEKKPVAKAAAEKKPAAKKAATKKTSDK
jgi:large subunit ribosomal protein L21